MSITRYINDPITRVGGWMVPHADGLYVRYADHIADIAAKLAAMQARAEAAESAIAEARQDYANLASTSGDMLKLAVARAEKAEADLEAYKARKTSINPWPWRNWRKK